MKYQPYPKKKDTPSRKSRKGERVKVFLHNKGLADKLRKERKAKDVSSEE